MASKAVQERVSAAQEILKDLIVIKDGVVVVDDSADEKLLAPLAAAGITKEAFEVSQTYAHEVLSAFKIEAARAANSAFKNDAELKQVAGEFKLGNATINVSVEKSHVFANPKDRENTVTKNLYTLGSVDIRGGLGKGSIGTQIDAIWNGLSS